MLERAGLTESLLGQDRYWATLEEAVSALGLPAQSPLRTVVSDELRPSTGVLATDGIHHVLNRAFVSRATSAMTGFSPTIPRAASGSMTSTVLVPSPLS